MVQDVGWFDSRTELDAAWEKYVEKGYDLLGEDFLHPDKVPFGSSGR